MPFLVMPSLVMPSLVMPSLLMPSHVMLLSFYLIFELPPFFLFVSCLLVRKHFSREHQKLHWKKHKSSCCAYKVSFIGFIDFIILISIAFISIVIIIIVILIIILIFQVCSSSELGRYLVATRDLKPGELVISETPLIIGPQVDNSYHRTTGG